MSTAVFFCLPAVGHVHPKLPIAAELVRRGDRVVFYCAEELRAKIEATGAEFRDIDWRHDLLRDQKPALTAIMVETARFCEVRMERLIREVSAIAPDYILNDFMCVWGRLVSRATKIPLVTMSSSFAISTDMLPPWPVLMALDIVSEPRRVFDVVGLRARADRLSKQYGVRLSTPFDMFSMDAERVLIATARAFQPDAHRYDDRFHFVGPCFEARGGEETSDLPKLDERPLVYVSLGTVFNKNAPFFERCIEAFPDGRYQVLMSVGKYGEALISRKKPPHIHALPYVPQLEVLKRAALFITHGGMNSTTEAICHEVPMLVSPQGGDQFVVAKQVEKLGVGRKLSLWHRSPKRLRELVDSVIGDADVRAKAKALKKSFETSGGTKRAADLLQSFATEKSKGRTAQAAEGR